MQREIRQSELASLIGCKQAYISALEVGAKLPTSAFVEKLITALDLPLKEGEEVRRIAAASQRKFVLDNACPQDVYWLFNELYEQARCLHPAQITLIREVLRLKPQLVSPQADFSSSTRNCTSDKSLA